MSAVQKSSVSGALWEKESNIESFLATEVSFVSIFVHMEPKMMHVVAGDSKMNSAQWEEIAVERTPWTNPKCVGECKCEQEGQEVILLSARLD
jgi:hypothetical protein